MRPTLATATMTAAIFFFTGFGVPAANASASTTREMIPDTATITPPVENAVNRVTKKTFGLYIRPGHSPVSPERFRGYHTGVDFETTKSERKTDVPVSAICAGPLVLKKWANGYGGVAVQRCRVNGEDVTVVYGHLKLASIKIKTGEPVAQGDRIGLLGKAYSHETDGERRHLHLGIHKGTAINILGYVNKKSSLDQWIDVMTFLRPEP